MPEPGKNPEKYNPWAQVGKFTQLAFMLPAATAVGWLIGTGLDHWLHKSWISTVGLILGSIAGLIEVIGVAASDSKNS